MSEPMEDPPAIPNINLEGSKSDDVYEVNANVIIAVVVVLLLLIGGLIFWKVKGSKKELVTPTPTPTEQVTLPPTSTPTATPSVSITPGKETTPTLSPKQKVKIEVLNGTGVTGEASFLKGKLTSAGFATIDTGNAASTSADAKTEVTYFSTFPVALKIDLTTLLSDLYTSVSATNSAESGKYDAIITTGKRK
ncbi:LytR C-terminal domain-containing protein [Candidatus Gottesmanbacteria bacterium]|nr:LytR C-terminal domain-containing protein [Candidatus Gottesmanbacteria bacterium]